MLPKQTITRAELARLVQEKVDTNLEEIKSVVHVMFEAMKHSLAAGQRIELRGFGSFVIKHRKGRAEGINPFTQKKMGKSPDHSVVIFKPGRDLKELVRDLKHE